MAKHFVEHRVTGRFGTIQKISNRFVLVRLHHRDGFEMWPRQNCLCYTSVVDHRVMGGSLNRAADAFEALRQEMRGDA